jgi:hypothetical protein
MVSAYRRDDDVLQERVDEVLEDRRHEATALGLSARRMVARRMGRAAAGAVGIGGGLLLLGLAVAAGLKGGNVLSIMGHGPGDGHLVEVLLGTWPVMGLGYVLGMLAGERWLDGVLRERPVLTGRAREDLASLQRARPPRAAVLRLLDRLAGPSLGYPLAAMGLLMPLTLHLAAWALFTHGAVLEHLHAFDEWIGLSAVYVGLAHLVLAALGLRFGAQRCSRSTTHWGDDAASGMKAVALTVLAACLPGVVLIAIPPVLVAVTGAVFVPLTFHRAGKRLDAERAALAPLLA